MTTNEYRYDATTDEWSWWLESDGTPTPTLSAFESDAPDPIYGPEETILSRTGSGEYVTAPNVGRVGHAPAVIGNAATSGTPTNWSNALPAWDAAHKSDVKRGRNKRGTTAQVTRHGRVMLDLVDNDREAHVAAMADGDYTRASEHEMARMATTWARMTCDACADVWQSCERDHDDADFCKLCASGCGCMPNLMGGTLVAFSEVIHAGEGAECAVAQRHGSLSDALSGLNLKPDQIREFRDSHVSETRTDGSAIVTRDESKLAWPTRESLPAPAWRKSETSTVRCATVAYDDDTATVYDDATVTMLPAPTVDGVGRFCGFVRYDDRGLLASEIRDHGRAIATGDQIRARAELAEINDHAPIEIGETQSYPINGATVRVTRNGVALYSIVRGKQRTTARTFSLAMRAVERLAS